MKFELVQELRDAGFPHDWTVLWDEPENFPTLSELIEACGDELCLTNLMGIRTKYDQEYQGWAVFKNYGVEKAEDIGTGDTPEEAVARLWLALQSAATAPIT